MKGCCTNHQPPDDSVNVKTTSYNLLPQNVKFGQFDRLIISTALAISITDRNFEPINSTQQNQFL